jgi:hypothetical protein
LEVELDSSEERARKAHEVRTRRLAKWAGFRLIKHRSRNKNVPEYGQWNLIDEERGHVVFDNDFGASLEEVEEYLLR